MLIAGFWRCLGITILMSTLMVTPYIIIFSMCSAAILAVDHVMANPCNVSISTTGNEEKETTHKEEVCSRAFVIGRPPGHHAGPHG